MVKAAAVRASIGSGVDGLQVGDSNRIHVERRQECQTMVVGDEIFGREIDEVAKPADIVDPTLPM